MLGICAALLAAGQRPEQAAYAASVQAYAARRHPGPVPPQQQLAEHLPETIAEMQRRARAIDDEIARTGW